MKQIIDLRTDKKSDQFFKVVYMSGIWEMNYLFSERKLAIKEFNSNKILNPELFFDNQVVMRLAK